MCCSSDNRIIQSVLITHNVIDTVALSFHLVHHSLKEYANPETLRYFDKIHKDSHTIEPFLHTVGFIGDLVDSYNTFNSKGFKWKKLANLRTAGRVCHTVSHFLSAASFLVKNLKVMNLNKLQPLFKYQTLLNALGHALCLSAVIWQRHQVVKQDQEKHQQLIRLGMFGGGFVAEALELVSNWSVLDDYSSTIGKIASLAGIIKCVSSNIYMLPPKEDHCHDHKNHYTSF